MGQRGSILARVRDFARHWVNVLCEIRAATTDLLLAQATRAERVGAELVSGSMLAVLMVISAQCWMIGVLNCAYEYDEVARAHWVWLSSQGLRPYQDFFENHPPYQYLLLPVARVVEDAGRQLTVYRVL